MKKSAMLAKARIEFPQFFQWGFITNHNSVESLLMPVQDPEEPDNENWYPGIWECQFDAEGDIVSVSICKILKHLPFATKGECYVALQKMPF